MAPPPGSTGDDWHESDWRLIAESIPHIVWVADPDGRTLYFNQRGTDYTGARGDVATWADLVHPEDLDRSTTCWAQARRTQTGFQEDLRIRRHDGTYLWHTARSQPLLDADGRITRWIGTATDIDDRKRLEQDLIAAHRHAAEAATLLATLQATAPVGFGFVDRDLRLVQINEELATFVGLSVDDQIGRTVAELAPELWGQLEPIYRHVLEAGGSVRNVPLTSVDAIDGGHREWLASYYPVRIDDEVVGVGLVVVDVTDRVHAERFRSTVMSQVADGVYTQDADGRLTYMNRAASKMLGWNEDELRGRQMHDVVHFQRADGSRVETEDCALLSEGLEHRLVRATGEAFTRKDGTIFPVAYSSMPLRIGTRVDGVSVVFRDLSEPGTSTNLIRVVIADADDAWSDAVTGMLTRHEGIEVVSVARTASSAVEQAQTLRPDVVILDALLPEVGGAATALRIKAEAPRTSILLLALDHDDALAAGAIAAGCAGVVDKRRAWVELASAVRAAFHGETSISQAELQQVVTKVRDSWRPGRAQDLTARERDVLLCLTQGLSNQQVATRLGVTVNTVRNHVQRILYKLDVHSRFEAVVLATHDGMLDDVLQLASVARTHRAVRLMRFVPVGPWRDHTPVACCPPPRQDGSCATRSSSSSRCSSALPSASGIAFTGMDVQWVWLRSAHSTTSLRLMITPGTNGPDLYPGSTSSVTVTVSNPNAYPVLVTSISAGSSNLVNGTCAAGTVTSDVRAMDVAGLAQTSGGPAISAGGSGEFTLVTHMTAGALDSCKLQTFTLPLTATLASAA